MDNLKNLLLFLCVLCICSSCICRMKSYDADRYSNYKRRYNNSFNGDSLEFVIRAKLFLLNEFSNSFNYEKEDKIISILDTFNHYNYSFLKTVGFENRSGGEYYFLRITPNFELNRLFDSAHVRFNCSYIIGFVYNEKTKKISSAYRIGGFRNLDIVEFLNYFFLQTNIIHKSKREFVKRMQKEVWVEEVNFNCLFNNWLKKHLDELNQCSKCCSN